LVQIFFSWSEYYYLPAEAANLVLKHTYSHRRIYVLMGKTLWACVVTSVIVLVRLLVSHTPSILFV
jgi:hypothetical protein